MKYKKYPSYKDSGVEWLGEIPENWNEVKLKYLVAITTGNKDTENKEPDGEYPFFVRSKTVERIKSYSYNGEAILTAGDGDIGKIFHYINGKFDFHQRVYMFYKFKNIFVKFLYFYLKENLHKEVIKLSAKTTVDSLRLPMLQDFVISIPPLQEQQQIANFLDTATSKIDTLIEKQTKLIELLKEKRQAVISHAVTKGLDPDVKRKDSGVEWLGEVPESWSAVSMKWISTIYAGGTPDKSNLHYWTDGTIPWINSGEVNQLHIKTPSTYITKEAYLNSSAKWIKKNSLVMALAGQGKTKGMVARLDIETTCNQSMAAIEPSEEIDSNYLLYWLTSNYQRIRNMAGGDLRDGLNLDLLGNIPCPILPLKEQQAIADYLDDKTFKIDSLVSKATKSIELLKEKRTALISAAVTGKIDVREIA